MMVLPLGCKATGLAQWSSQEQSTRCLSYVCNALVHIHKQDNTGRQLQILVSWCPTFASESIHGYALNSANSLELRDHTCESRLMMPSSRQTGRLFSMAKSRRCPNIRSSQISHRLSNASCVSGSPACNEQPGLEKKQQWLRNRFFVTRLRFTDSDFDFFPPQGH